MSAAVLPTDARIAELAEALRSLRLPRDRVAYKKIQAELRLLKTGHGARLGGPTHRRPAEPETWDAIDEARGATPVAPVAPPPPAVAPPPKPEVKAPMVGISFLDVLTPLTPAAPLAPASPPVQPAAVTGPAIFLSHSSRDVGFLENELIPLLNERGIRTWSSNRDIPPGGSWNDSISRGLEQCDWFAVILSPEAVVSKWVKLEVHWAFINRDPDQILPVFYRDCRYKTIHWALETIQHLNYLGDPARARQQMLARLTGQAAGGRFP